MKILKYITAKHFFNDYAPHVKNWSRKMIGKTTRGNPLEFTNEDLKHIQNGMDIYHRDFLKAIKSTGKFNQKL